MKIEKMLFEFMFVSLLVLLVSSTVEGHYPGYVVDAVYGSAPVIDGIVNPDEWSDASVISFNNTIVYFKQDGNFLYIGFNVSDNTVSPNDDTVGFLLDINHDGALQQQDIMLSVYRNGTLAEASDLAPLTPPTGGWDAKVQDQNERWTAEFNITYAKINVTAGVEKTLGILITSADHAYPEPYLWPPVGTWGVVNPAVWGDLTSEAKWIPEFPLPIILVTLIATTLTATTLWKTKRKHQFV